MSSTMHRLPRALAYVAGGLLVLSSGAHSFLGWSAMRPKMTAGHLPADLIDGIGMGWHFAGLAMLVLGLMVFWLLAVSRRGQTNVRVPLLLIGCAYLLYATGCAVAVGWDPFLMTFFLPGILLSIAGALMPAQVASATE